MDRQLGSFIAAVTVPEKQPAVDGQYCNPQQQLSNLNKALAQAAP